MLSVPPNHRLVSSTCNISRALIVDLHSNHRLDQKLPGIYSVLVSIDHQPDFYFLYAKESRVTSIVLIFYGIGERE